MIDKTTLKQEADKLFASTSYEVLWGSPAGEFFTCEKIGSKALKEGEKLIKFEKAPEATPEGKKEKTLNQGETIAAILKVETIEGLAMYEADERKGVKAAYDDQLAKLTAEIKVNLDNKGEGTGNGNEDTGDQK